MSDDDRVKESIARLEWERDNPDWITGYDTASAFLNPIICELDKDYADLRRILLDLIAELRDHAEDVRPAGDKKVPWRIVANYLDGYADRAEARLKGLNDE